VAIAGLVIEWLLSGYGVAIKGLLSGYCRGYWAGHCGLVIEWHD